MTAALVVVALVVALLAVRVAVRLVVVVLVAWEVADNFLNVRGMLPRLQLPPVRSCGHGGDPSSSCPECDRMPPWPEPAAPLFLPRPFPKRRTGLD